MTSLERIRCAARRQPVDQIPVAPYMGILGANLASASARDRPSEKRSPGRVLGAVSISFELP